MANYKSVIICSINKAYLEFEDICLLFKIFIKLFIKTTRGDCSTIEEIRCTLRHYNWSFLGQHQSSLRTLQRNWKNHRHWNGWDSRRLCFIHFHDNARWWKTVCKECGKSFKIDFGVKIKTPHVQRVFLQISSLPHVQRS